MCKVFNLLAKNGKPICFYDPKATAIEFLISFSRLGGCSLHSGISLEFEIW
jgi:hypothetical protein